MSETKQGTATTATAEKATKKSGIAKVTKTTASNKPEVKAEAQKKNRSTLLDHLKVTSENLIVKPKGGNTGDHLFREGILPKDNKNSARKKIRKNLDVFASNFKAHADAKNAKALKGLKADFDAYYAKVYKTNDYTLASLLGGNTKGPRKASIEGMLKIIKGIK